MHPFDKHYFHGGGKVGGYAGAGYRDFPVHWTTFFHAMQRSAPKSVLELGCGRGYLLKRFADYAQLAVKGLEISEHCYLTRAVEEVITHDVTKPWPLGDQTYDLCLSLAFLEHVPEEQLPAVFDEMRRVCQRGLHGIDIHEGDGFDKTHCTLRPIAWWKDRLPPGHEAVDKEDLEVGGLVLPFDIHDGVKLNLGSFTHMFHGWRNLDFLDLAAWSRANGYTFTQWDLRKGLPYDDQVAHLMFMSHVLEHFDYEAGCRLLAECRRVLKPGGWIRIAVPHAAALMAAHASNTLGRLYEISGSTPEDSTQIQLLHELLYGGDHRAIYDEATLVKTLHRAGFTQVAFRAFRESVSPVMRRETIDLYPELSLFVEASP